MNAHPLPLPPDEPVEVRAVVNGRATRRHVPPRMHLADFLRHELNLTATHVGVRAWCLRSMHRARKR